MRESLRDIIRRVVSGSILLGGAAVPAVPAVAAEHPTVDLPPPPSEVGTSMDRDEMVLRERRPRLVLKRASDMSLALISSHRSHRSHSSHRSHYSSYGGGGGGTYTPPRTRRRSSPPPAPVAAYCIPSYEGLGARVLQRGMCGADVTELMRLLVAHGQLESYQVNSESMFTREVETAVKAFQRANKKKADGKVGPVTLRLLRGNP